MAKELKRSNKQRKINIFLVFLLCSFLAWLVSKLSETYTTTVSFSLNYINTPDSLVFSEASFDQIDSRLQSTGFQLLKNNFYDNRININLESIRSKNGSYYLTQADYQKQIEKQVSGTMNLLEINGDTLFFELFSLKEKEVSIITDLNLNPAQNYLIDDMLLVEPAVITIKGPREELEMISSISTVEVIKENIADDFSFDVNLVKPLELKNSVLSHSSVRISGKVFRFSEKLLEVAVRVINLPEGTEISTFPSTVSVLCKARVDALKNIKASDIQLIADFKERKPNTALLPLQLGPTPEGIYDMQLLTREVEFILKRP